jgi:hypothetical protein
LPADTTTDGQAADELTSHCLGNKHSVSRKGRRLSGFPLSQMLDALRRGHFLRPDVLFYFHLSNLSVAVTIPDYYLANPLELSG